MSRNRKWKQKMAASLAAGMSVVLSAVPVCAVGSENAGNNAVCKEETVYVNTDAAGKQKSVTVSEQLKGIRSTGIVADESILDGIKNIKGDENVSQNGNRLTWQAKGEDIFYQGTTEQELPVSMKTVYILDGKEISPEELDGKNGHLEIRITYENHAKRTVSVKGGEETVFSPIVLVTGLILPNKTCSDVRIDNGKVINDGDKNIILGVAMPGLKESLGMKEGEAAEILTIPDTLTISADVEDFSMPSTYTVGLTDVLDEIDPDSFDSLDELSDSLAKMEDAALELVQGSKELSKGADTLGSRYAEFDQGIDTMQSGIDVLDAGAASLAAGIAEYTSGTDTLNAGIQTYFGENGELSATITEYKNGVNTLLAGIEEYTEGADTLADGVNTYVAGEEKLAEGAKQLSALSEGLTRIQEAVRILSESTDGTGSAEEDLLVAAGELADGTETLSQALKSETVQKLLEQVDEMTKTGQELTSAAGELGKDIEKEIAGPASEITASLQTLAGLLNEVNEKADLLEKGCSEQVAKINRTVEENNRKIQMAKKAAAEGEEQIAAAQAGLNQQIQALRAAGQEEAAAQIETAVQSLENARTSAQSLQNLSGLDTVEMPDFSGIDTEELSRNASSLESEIRTVVTSSGRLSSRMTGLQDGLKEMEEKKDALPQTSMQEISRQVEILNRGMQGLYQAAGTLSGGLSELGKASDALQNGAAGIQNLQQGFESLGQYNEALKSGAGKLKDSSPSVRKGAQTLLGGTTQLSNGLDTLGSRLSSGSAALSQNSQALKEGAATLKSGTQKLVSGGASLKTASGQVQSGIDTLSTGAKTLADGMKQFEEEGISKLQEVTDTEFKDIADRFKALTGEECRYDTFAGKPEEMEGTVKFVIETEAVPAR
ncbi:hypothetical protein [Sellimonas sp.]|uniref:hypothetical protein n=1 Tax=Sellimonas sp. TaxID=2021466 RepID=UPI00257FCAA5|nr:hypothetical protein [Sellimonas sp.]